MTVTSDELDRVVNRVEFSESIINILLRTMRKMASLDQVRQLTSIRQAEIDNLTTRVSALETQMEAVSLILKL